MEILRQSNVRVAVLIVTRKRPAMLERLLRSLANLSFSASEVDLTIIVVDNDPEETSREVCANSQSYLPYSVRYLVEPKIGIPYARNRAVLEAFNNNEYVAFVDDDETVDPNWLGELLLARRQYDAEVIVGPVVSSLPGNAPAWAKAGKSFEHPNFVSGTQMHWCASNNVLVSTRVFAALEPWFDERLALSGGSDRLFFQRVAKADFKIIWSDKAVVREEIPASRVRVGWVLRRMYRQGISNAFSDVELATHICPRVRVAARASAWIILGIILLPLGLLTGFHRIVHYARYIAYGLGQWAALRGRLYNEYKVIHGR